MPKNIHDFMIDAPLNPHISLFLVEVMIAANRFLTQIL